MSVTVRFLVLLEAEPDKAAELAAFLEQGRELAFAEPLTVDWYALRFDQVTYGIFDTLRPKRTVRRRGQARSPRRRWQPRRNCSRRNPTSNRWT